jgi:prepilin-type N-terminal cleavage/methylation domain-containing protein
MICDLRLTICKKSAALSVFNHQPKIVNRKPKIENGFTMVEIAISLAIIGIALVAIVGVLPLGMNVQKENREATVINQDATVFIEAIRNGTRGLDDLTNYVLVITNFQTFYNPTPGTVNPIGYNNPFLTTYNNASSILTNGANIIGLLGRPEFTDVNGVPVNNLLNGNFYSNHVIAYVRSISGAAVEKPPQDNDIVRSDSFSYRLYCVNAPVAMSPPAWLSQQYNAGSQVSFNNIYWQAAAATTAQPGSSTDWVRISYLNQLAANLHELRLTFLWPQLPNGNVGSGRQTYRALVAGQVVTNIVAGNLLYFYQPQSFGSAP